MADTHMTVAADDDLPRTFRRDKAEKAQRDREAAEAAAAAERQRADAERAHALSRGGDMPRIFERGAGERTHSGASALDAGVPSYVSPPPFAEDRDPLQPSVVRALKIPFIHLMLFCLKLTLAAIPALILLAAILYGMGQVLKIYLPWLVQAEILIRFPK